MPHELIKLIPVVKLPESAVGIAELDEDSRIHFMTFFFNRNYDDVEHVFIFLLDFQKMVPDQRGQLGAHR